MLRTPLHLVVQSLSQGLSVLSLDRDCAGPQQIVKSACRDSRGQPAFASEAATLAVGSSGRHEAPEASLAFLLQDVPFGFRIDAGSQCTCLAADREPVRAAWLEAMTTA